MVLVFGFKDTVSRMGHFTVSVLETTVTVEVSITHMAHGIRSIRLSINKSGGVHGIALDTNCGLNRKLSNEEIERALLLDFLKQLLKVYMSREMNRIEKSYVMSSLVHAMWRNLLELLTNQSLQ